MNRSDGILGGGPPNAMMSGGVLGGGGARPPSQPMNAGNYFAGAPPTQNASSGGLWSAPAGAPPPPFPAGVGLAPPPHNGAVFGAPPPNTMRHAAPSPGGSAFVPSSGTNTGATRGSFFGSTTAVSAAMPMPQAPAQHSGSVFGSAPTTTTTSSFMPQQPVQQRGAVFGSGPAAVSQPTPQQRGAVFGSDQTTTTTTTIAAAAAASTPQPTKRQGGSMFGSPVAGAAATTPQPQQPKLPAPRSQQQQQEQRQRFPARGGGPPLENRKRQHPPDEVGGATPPRGGAMEAPPAATRTRVSQPMAAPSPPLRRPQPPPASSSTTRSLWALRFEMFARLLVDADKRESAHVQLEEAFFGKSMRLGMGTSASNTVEELVAVWHNVRWAGGVSGEVEGIQKRWSALFFLGSIINVMMMNLPPQHAPLTDEHRRSLMAGSRYATQLADFILDLFRSPQITCAAYSLLPILLHRVRSVFDELDRRGISGAGSTTQQKTVLSKLWPLCFNGMAAIKSDVGGPTPQWKLAPQTEMQCELIRSAAHLVVEMLLAKSPTRPDMWLFVDAFHRLWPHALEQRSALYFIQGKTLLQDALNTHKLQEAARCFVNALATSPPNAPMANTRLLYLNLLATNLALGKMPRDDGAQLDQLHLPQMQDVVMAVKAANLRLFDHAMRRHNRYFVEAEVHNALQFVRFRILLLMVVKYYLRTHCASKLSIAEMVSHYDLDYTEEEGETCWLLPLLMQGFINGQMERSYLILSQKKPFDEAIYAKELLVAAAVAEYGMVV